MPTFNTVILLLLATYFFSKSCQTEELHCKPKPGCHIAKCDPVPVGRSSPRHTILEYIERNEFPITCLVVKKERDEDAATSFPMLDGILKELKSLREELTELRVEISELKSKDIIKEKEVKGQKVKPQPPKRTRAYTTTVYTTPSTTRKSFSNLCEIVVGERTCLWTKVRSGLNITFWKAKKYCSRTGSVVGQVVNKQIYEKLMQNLRSKIPANMTFVYVWIGMTVDPWTGDVATPRRDAYTRWRQQGPIVGKSIEDTHVGIEVNVDPQHKYQGMVNGDPSYPLHGYVCQTEM